MHKVKCWQQILFREDLGLSRYFPRMDWYVGSAKMDRIRLEERVIAGAPKAMDGLRAVFASDVHLRANVSVSPLIDCIKSCRADIILFGGDFADTREQALRLFDAFDGLDAPMGMYAILGNNDTEAFEFPDALRKALNGCGVRLLVNESVQLDGFSVGGVDEHLYGCPLKDGLFSGREGYRILLSHYPILPEEKPDLMLSGHTHGGQFNALGLTPYAIGFERIGRRRHLAPAAVSGLHEIGNTKLLVSKGIGSSKIPLRIGVRPEVCLLKFEC